LEREREWSQVSVSRGCGGDCVSGFVVVVDEWGVIVGLHAQGGERKEKQKKKRKREGEKGKSKRKEKREGKGKKQRKKRRRRRKKNVRDLTAPMSFLLC